MGAMEPFTASINTIETEYTPGPIEIANGLVELTVTADAISPCVGTVTETITHTITRNPVVTLTTNEDTICESQASYTVPTGLVSIDNMSSVANFFMVNFRLRTCAREHYFNTNI